jgi:ribosomal protein L32
VILAVVNEKLSAWLRGTNRAKEALSDSGMNVCASDKHLSESSWQI